MGYKSFKARVEKAQEDNSSVVHKLSDVWALVISPTSFIDKDENINEAVYALLKSSSSIIQIRPAVTEASVVIFNLTLLREFINGLSKDYESNNPQLVGLYYGLPEMYKFILSKSSSLSETLQATIPLSDKEKVITELTALNIDINL